MLSSPRVSLRRLWSDLSGDTRLLLLLVALSMVNCVLFALINPPFLSPDETGHYDYVASLYQSGGARIVGGESHQPVLYYLLMVPAFTLASAVQPPTLEVYALAVGNASVAALLAIRLASALITVVTVPLAFWAAKSVYPKDRFVYLGTTAFVALIPMYSSIGASANNDVLANVLSAALISITVSGMAVGSSIRRSLLFTALAAAALATKTSTLPIVAVAFLAVALHLVEPVRARVASTGRPTLAILGCVAAAAVLLVARVALVQEPAASLVARFAGYVTTGKLVAVLSRLDPFPFEYQFRTFWATFDNDSIQLPELAYWFLLLLSLGALAGILLRLLAAVRRPRGSVASHTPSYHTRQLALIGVFAAAQGVVPFMRLLGSNLGAVTPLVRVAGWSEDVSLMQGRFVFPALIALAFLFVWGLRGFVPKRLEPVALAGLVVSLLVVDAVALVTLFVGFYSWQY